MRIFHFASVSICLACLASPSPGQEPAGYYASAIGKTGAALKSALHLIIRNHTSVGYSGAWEALRVTDQHPTQTNSVLTIYSRRAELKTNNGGGQSNWNREHVWPNSYGIDDTEPIYSDLFNLRPEDVTVNGDRDNNPFDESDSSIAGYQNPSHPESTLCSEHEPNGSGRPLGSWEPPDVVKGDIARGIFYMDVRYEGTSGEPDLRLTDNMSLVGSTANYMGKLTTLLVWNALDPVDETERARNQTIFSQFQHNRNPFVDHPEWVPLLYGEILDLSAQQKTASQIEISWPAALADLGIAERSSTLASNSWEPITSSALSIDRRVSLETLISRRFYRLRLTYRR